MIDVRKAPADGLHRAVALGARALGAGCFEVRMDVGVFTLMYDADSREAARRTLAQLGKLGVPPDFLLQLSPSDGAVAGRMAGGTVEAYVEDGIVRGIRAARSPALLVRLGRGHVVRQAGVLCWTRCFPKCGLDRCCLICPHRRWTGERGQMRDARVNA